MDVDDTLVLILEQIDSPVSLIRAASTCRRWRRLIADAGFLRRHRSLHGPPVAGDYYNGDPIPAPWGRWNTVVGHRLLFVPCSSIDPHRFSPDFLVGARIFPHREHRCHTWSWKVRDSRGSLLLMEYTHRKSTHPTSIHEEYSHEMRMSICKFPDLVVYEPLTQRYKVIPQPPDFYGAASYMFRGPFLVAGDEDEAGGRIGMSNFRLQCVIFNYDDVVAYTTMFTAAGDDMDGMWRDKAIDHIASRLHPTRQAMSRCLGHALGLYYFYVQDGALITRNGSTGKFSLLVLPDGAIKSCWNRNIYTENFTVVDGGDGEPRVVIMTYDTMEVFARSSLYGEWALEKKVVLPKVTCSVPSYYALTIVKKGVGFVVISPWEPNQQPPFSVDLKTMEVAPATEGTREMMAYRCEFPWPPVLQVCLDR